MNIFCRCLSESIFKRFNIEADVFVSKRKKLVHIAFERALISYYFFDELINFIEHYWHERKYFFYRISFCVSKVKSKPKMEKRLYFL